MRRSYRSSSTPFAVTLIAAVLAAVACGDSPAPVAPVAPNEISFDAVSASPAAPGPDDWIVVFKPGVADPPGLARQLVAEHGGTLRFTYQYAIQGFSATLPAQSLNGIRNNPNVEYVEADGVVTVDGSGSDATPGSWGLDRIDESNLPLDGSYRWDFDGTGVHAYIIDTGIWPTHVDFGGRATADADFIGDGRNGIDNCHGHGTHVAGTIGGSEYGVAKNVHLHGVRVLSCSGSGTWAQVIAGVDWVMNNRINPAVANMSLGGGVNATLNTAVNNAVADGVTFAVSAGNSSADACNQSPASAASALTVGSTTSSDSRSSFSNYGTCVDIFAPGSSIKSDYNTSNTATATLSGTSMASPHVAGAAALILDEHSGWTPAQVAAEIDGRVTAGVLSNVGTGSPNKLLCSLADCTESGGAAPLVPVVTNVSAVTLGGGRKHVSGSVDVTVEADGGPAAGVTVAGDWYKNSDSSPAKADQGVAGSDGIATISSGSIKGATTLRFCVTSLSGLGYENVDVSPPECSGSGGGGGGGGGGSTPADPPSDLTATVTTNRGGKTKVQLAWTAWAASTVDVLRNGTVIAAGISNDGSHTDNQGASSDRYLVCDAGSASSCTNEAVASP